MAVPSIGADPTGVMLSGVHLLLARPRAISAERGWNTVGRITGDDNHRARSKYNQVATPTMFVTYDMPQASA
ncbi:hypothetical protein [Kitasatospora purpeofusca]|uniref:hypothetical protein n=1 Tax=Kitasatospora purpeofusca TaxID=67352 RepID=UPI0037F6962C